MSMEVSKLVLMLILALAVSFVLFTPTGKLYTSTDGRAYKALSAPEQETNQIPTDKAAQPTSAPACTLPPSEQEMGTTGYVYSGSDKIAGLKLGVMSYYHSDYLGSSRLVSDACGKTRWESDYYPFGETLKENSINKNNDYKFTGKEYDEEMNLYYYGARYYDSKIGRFTQVDPMLRDFGNYIYSSNNPLIIKDPDGAEEVDARKTLIQYPIRASMGFTTSYSPQEGSSYTRQLTVQPLTNPKYPTVQINAYESTSANRLNPDVVSNNQRGGGVTVSYGSVSVGFSQSKEGQNIISPDPRAPDQGGGATTQRISAEYSIYQNSNQENLNENVKAGMNVVKYESGLSGKMDMPFMGLSTFGQKTTADVISANLEGTKNLGPVAFTCSVIGSYVEATNEYTQQSNFGTQQETKLTFPNSLSAGLQITHRPSGFTAGFNSYMRDDQKPINTYNFGFQIPI